MLNSNQPVAWQCRKPIAELVALAFHIAILPVSMESTRICLACLLEVCI